ncbi:glutamyl-tRNA reductase [Pyrobaculum neutrophilum]|uniref:Glutamyl-tRNA reductase n=1 Tax=Pyrobaculum neutrophilum (strain DSM 2338 / JCM 9278 / NBRC 100436 / V24Sta) TaxID=444157 RepID=HEM1_PYRNV|nr:glutamyl-tRNA reductase [Pyrobaculum neutrophilum]B1YBN0.1 RecName: Full=Glutamyl-tRNA reductase; Short=GluTR [Pyrobaculum neutrophilum V24Sta]ACB40832.1 glutamyl-tRNA reductase [Pyrobaculum neutrophilum V24Sta]
MDLLAPLSAVVLTYREVSAEALGKVGQEMKRCIERRARAFPMYVLHTCSRVEAYLYGAPPEEVQEVAEAYRRYVDSVRVITGAEAARHLFRVAAGLDSILIGETDVLGQVEEAFDRQVRAGYTRGLLKTVVERAVRVGKRVRTETAISRGPRGLGSLSIIYVSRLLDLRQAKAAVLGAGAVGSGLAMELASRGVGKLYILNRTFEKAREVAAKTGGEARPLTREEVERCLRECDVVFSSVHSMEYVIDRVPEGASVKIVVDLGVPQTVAPGLPVKVVRIEDLRQVAEQYNAERAAEVAKAEAIVEEELAALPRLLARRYVEETVAALLETAMTAAEEEGARAGCDAAALAAKTTVKRVLLPLVEKMKKMAEDGQMEEAVRLANVLTQAVGRKT